MRTQDVKPIKLNLDLRVRFLPGSLLFLVRLGHRRFMERLHNFHVTSSQFLALTGRSAHWNLSVT